MSPSFSVFAVYETRAGVETAADTLMSEGFPSRDISVLFPENVLPIGAASAPEPKSNEAADKSARPEGVISGALGVLAGLGPLVGEGTLKAGLAGLGVKSAVGDLAQSLIGIGVPELEAKRYEDRLQQNAILVSVKCPTPEAARQATEIIKRTGGQDASTTTPPAGAPEANLTEAASSANLAKIKARGSA
jgi:hypothetical protein